jgi:long-chain fatty acid transport protein
MSKRFKHKQFIKLLAAGVLPFIAQPALSAGFALSEQNGSGLATAYAGAASIAEDASTGYYNVAGLARLKNEQIAASAVWVIPNTSLSATGATPTYAAGITSGPLSQLGAGTAKSREGSVVPALHYANRIDDCWAFGLNITSPFGLKTKYTLDSIARYTATRSELKTFDISPAIAYGFQNGLSLGVGVDAVYVVAKLDSQIGTGNRVTDGFINNNADNWGFGYHAGILYEFSDSTRVGVNYRSRVKVKPKGETIFQFAAGGIPETREGVRSKVILPESVTLSGYHDFNDCLAAMVDVQWTHWASFKNLELGYPDEGSRLRLPQNFKNAVRVSVGGSYQWNDQLKLKIGTAYDKTPTQDAWRSIRLPDQNRIWAAVGGQYRFNKCLALDVGYAHLFFKKARINEVAPRLENAGSIQRLQGRQTFNGTSKGRADLIGVQLTWDLV